jgi:hypothetical protein
MSTNHERGFRPSHFAALENCIYHQQKEAGPAAENGIDFHSDIAHIIKTDPTMPECVEALDWPNIAWANALVTEYVQNGWDILYVEKEITLAAPDGNTMTNGTLDLVLEKDRHFIIIDWKTGEQIRDYSAQMAGYIMALEELHLEAESTRALIAFVDLKQTVDHTQSYPDAAIRVTRLYKKWKAKNEPYTINPYCDWCARRPECPAWRESADRALARLNGIQSPDGSFQQAKIDHLKNNPADLEAFLALYERMTTLVDDEWKLKSALKSHMETGYKAEHFSLVKIKDKEIQEETIDPEQFLLHVVKHLGAMKAAGAVKIDPAKAKELWAATMVDRPFPVSTKILITTKSGYSYIRAKK